ncbi:hypothetical protein [Pontibacter rugosus]
MNSNIYSSTIALVETCLGMVGLPAVVYNNVPPSEDEPTGYATIDGNMISHHVGSDAVSNGAGIFIGDYFVGITDNYESASNSLSDKPLSIV